MRFREHRGLLAEAMDTMVTLDGRAALVTHVRSLLQPWKVAFRDEDVLVARYGSGPDPRIGWPATFVVTVKGYGVIGFTDGDDR